MSCTEIKTIKLFLASSAELREDRDAFDLYFQRQNPQLLKHGLFLDIDRWEYFIDAMSPTRKQDDYNQAVRECDIFVSLYSTKVGQYTEEEFEVAYQTFQATKTRPKVYTYFKNTQINIADVDMKALTSLKNFQEKLDKLGHFYTSYNDTEHLKRLFNDQLQMLRNNGELS